MRVREIRREVTDVMARSIPVLVFVVVVLLGGLLFFSPPKREALQESAKVLSPGRADSGGRSLSSLSPEVDVASARDEASAADASPREADANRSLVGLAKRASAIMMEFKGDLFEVLAEEVKRESVEGNGEQVVRSIIDQMGDDELDYALTHVVGLSEQEVGELSDVREFTTRLTVVGLSGIVFDPIEFSDSMESTKSPEEDAEEEFEGVVFGSWVDEDEEVIEPRTSFDPSERKIYAEIPTPGPEVVVKWYRSDEPDIHLFQRYSCNDWAPRCYVWVMPKEEWPTGAYTVEFFEANEQLDPIAAGSYEIVD